jgi:uncharacterized membrane protein YfcA
MFSITVDLSLIIFVLLGALAGGFTTGLAGFGTGLVASGFWLQAIPAQAVPPLVMLTSVFGQIVSLLTVRKAFDWRQTWPYLAGGVIGVPLGILALERASPFAIKTSVGSFLIAYSVYQLVRRKNYHIGNWGGRTADGAVGFAGGILGGFAGLSGPPPLIWLQLRGGDPDQQRATYQPFNLIMLTLAGMGMAIGGRMTSDVLGFALLCLPASLVGAVLGSRVYTGVSPQTFQRAVLCLLLLSGCILIGPALIP